MDQRIVHILQKSRIVGEELIQTTAIDFLRTFYLLDEFFALDESQILLGMVLENGQLEFRVVALEELCTCRVKN